MDQPSRHFDLFYHGTWPHAVESIVRQGFRLRVWTDKETGERCRLEGCLGAGVYITKNWSAALWFGAALLGVKLKPGTRILSLDAPPDTRVVESLRREFGDEIIAPEALLHKIIPRNKHLTRSELAELTRYHFQRTWGDASRKKVFHGLALIHCASLLRRYKYDGYGHPTSDMGIVILDPTRVLLREIIAVLPERSSSGRPLAFRDLEALRAYFRRHGEEEHRQLAEQVAARFNIGHGATVEELFELMGRRRVAKQI